MADDIVTRLRCWWCAAHPDELKCDPCVAADEIERLRAAGDVIACVLASLVGDRADVQRLLDAWEEARRG